MARIAHRETALRHRADRQEVRGNPRRQCRSGVSGEPVGYFDGLVLELSESLRTSSTRGLAYSLRILQIMVRAEFKLKYAGSALGYVWSVVKPLSLFTVLYLVFGRIFKLDVISEFYALALLIGIVLFSFFADGTSQGMVALVHRESLLRRMRFPRVIIPTAATLTAAMTFGINLMVVAGFVAWQGIVPRLDWVLLLPLLLELYLFTLGTALLLATVFVSLRDMGQVWELGVQLLFYASAIVYPLSSIPHWARELAFLFPFTQVMQDVRALVLYDDTSGITITAGDTLGELGRLVPIAIALFVFALGVGVFKRHEPWFAERT
jgi:ABC-2 type transport system permease protein